MFRRISVIGGDLRQLTAAKLFTDDGYEVTLYGFDEEQCEAELEKALDADAVILPMPVSTDGVYLNAPFCKRKISLNEVVQLLNPSAVVFGGQMKAELVSELEKCRIKHCDYLNREELAIKNAVPTAFSIWVLIQFLFGSFSNPNTAVAASSMSFDSRFPIAARYALFLCGSPEVVTTSSNENSSIVIVGFSKIFIFIPPFPYCNAAAAVNASASTISSITIPYLT